MRSSEAASCSLVVRAFSLWSSAAPAEISLLVVVLTSNTHASLARLLSSLSGAHYGCAKSDIYINIDMSANLRETRGCLNVARRVVWTHGTAVG